VHYVHSFSALNDEQYDIYIKYPGVGGLDFLKP